MNKVFKGSAFKKWFLDKPDVRRVLKPKGNSFYLFKSLDEIDDSSHYTLTTRQYGEVILEEVQLISE